MKEGSDTLPEIFKLLLMLHSPDADVPEVIQELEKCRINPNFHPDAKVRNDLEFYIPQLT